MLLRHSHARPDLHVIDGGLSGRPIAVPAPAPPGRMPIGASELAAGLAEAFAMVLLRDVPLAALSHPHHVVRPAPHITFTLHDLLCELRSLPWFDRHGPLSRAGTAADPSSPIVQGDADHRRAIRWNGDGQLTLAGLFSGPVAQKGEEAGIMSRLLLCGARTSLDGATAAPRPTAESADLTEWQDWTRTVLDLAGDAATPATAADLARLVHDGQPMRAPMAAALWLLDQGMPRDPGLPEAAWQGGAAMIDAMMQAARAAARTAESLPQAIRPAPVATRLSLWLCHEDPGHDADTPLIAAALGELAHFTPCLLGWMLAHNRALADHDGARHDGRPMSLMHDLTLPPVLAGDMPVRPARAAGAGVTIGAALTVLKACMATHAPSGRRVALVGSARSPRRSLQGEIDRLAANLALGRLAAGRILGCQSHEELRRGEAVAIDLLRQRLGALGQPATLTFETFDGRRARLLARPSPVGACVTELQLDGVMTPAQGNRASVHLRAVP